MTEGDMMALLSLYRGAEVRSFITTAWQRVR